MCFVLFLHVSACLPLKHLGIRPILHETAQSIYILDAWDIISILEHAEGSVQGNILDKEILTYCAPTLLTHSNENINVRLGSPAGAGVMGQEK